MIFDSVPFQCLTILKIDIPKPPSRAIARASAPLRSLLSPIADLIRLAKLARRAGRLKKLVRSLLLTLEQVDDDRPLRPVTPRRSFLHPLVRLETRRKSKSVP